MLRLSVLILALVTLPVQAAEVLVAVAANFVLPMQKIASSFEVDTVHKVKMSIGSTGGFEAQIRHGAPFDVLLAADGETPARLEKDRLTAGGSRFTYALGRLVLWSAKPGVVDAKGEVLQRGSFSRVAIANPKLAPYGQAAVETMQRLGVYERLAPRVVQGENIGQAYQIVASGNAALGFVALSQVMVEGRMAHGSAWIVPPNLHSPIKQDAVLLARGQANPAAREFMQFLKGEKARGIIRAYGYELP